MLKTSGNLRRNPWCHSHVTPAGATVQRLAANFYVHIRSSPVATTGGFGGIIPPNWNMKHCKLVEFLSNLYVKSSPHKRKAPLLTSFWIGQKRCVVARVPEFASFNCRYKRTKQNIRRRPTKSVAIGKVYNNIACCNLSGGVALNVWFTTNGMCAKNNDIYTRGANKQ